MLQRKSILLTTAPLCPPLPYNTNTMNDSQSSSNSENSQNTLIGSEGFELVKEANIPNDQSEDPSNIQPGLLNMLIEDSVVVALPEKFIPRLKSILHN